MCSGIGASVSVWAGVARGWQRMGAGMVQDGGKIDESTGTEFDDQKGCGVFLDQ